jgi:hypothetical protein
MPTSTIFIRTYTLDLPWFRWCIASIGKFWAEDSKILVSCEEPDVEEVKGILGQYCHDRKWAVQPWVQWGAGKAYIFQQWQKLVADTLTDSEVIVFFDSDLLINRTIGLSDFMNREGKKIRWFYEPYPSVETSEPQACKWLNPTWRAMNIKPEHEYMRRHPFLVWRETLEGCRKYLESQHGPLHEYLLNIPGQGSDIPFSEFNCLGFYAWIFQGDKYWFINVNEAKQAAGDKYFTIGTKIGDNPVDQFHSWTGDVNQARARFEQACENPDYLAKQGEIIREANPVRDIEQEKWDIIEDQRRMMGDDKEHPKFSDLPENSVVEVMTYEKPSRSLQDLMPPANPELQALLDEKMKEAEAAHLAGHAVDLIADGKVVHTIPADPRYFAEEVKNEKGESEIVNVDPLPASKSS